MGAKTERLVNLVVTLLDARRPLTLRELKDRTGLYDQDEPESARRMFERDKDDLRRLGVPLETRELSSLDSDFGYVIEREEYELPDVDLTRDEVTALAVALQLSEAGPGRLGLTKLAARAPDPVSAASGEGPAGGRPEGDRPGGGAAPVVGASRVTVRADRLDDLAGPLYERRTVAFGYRTAGGDAERRVVDPYAVVARRGAWYLVGRDHDRDALRTFRVDRMTTDVESRGGQGSFEVPEDLDVDGAVSGPRREGVEVRLALDPSLRWEAERRGGVDTGERHDGRPVHRFADTDPERLRPWVLALGPRGEVLSPAALRDEVVAHLEAVVAELGGDSSYAPDGSADGG